MAGFIKEVYNEGKLEGKLEGLMEGKSELIIKLLTIKFKEMPTSYIKKLASVSPQVLDEIGNHIFEINKLEELDQYLIH